MPSGKAPQAGPQKPEKYNGNVGPKYKEHGELEYAGYVYMPPPVDDYYYDPKAQARYEAEAKKEILDEYGEKPPSMGEQLLPVATIAATPALVEHGLVPAIKGLPGLLGLGGGGIATPEVISLTRVPAVAGGSTAAAAGGASTAGGGTAAAGEFSLAGVAPIAGPLVGAATIGDMLLHDRGKTSNALRGMVGAGAAAMPFFGALGPVGLGAAILGGGLLGLGGGGIFGRKTTADYQAERRKELLDQNVTGYADLQKLVEKTAADDPNHGKVPDMNNLKPEQVVGSYGIFKTFGNDWLGGKYTHEQRMEIARRLVEARLFKGDKGDLVITDPVRAKQIADEVEKGSVQDGPAAAPRPEATSASSLATTPSQAPAPSGGIITTPQRSYSSFGGLIRTPYKPFWM